MKLAAIKGKRKRVRDDDRIGFHHWNLEAMDKLENAVRKTVGEMLMEGFEIAMKEYDCEAWFAVEYNEMKGAEKGDGDRVLGKRPNDHSTIFVRLPIGRDEDSGPVWSFSLSKMLDETIDMYVSGDGLIHGEDRLELLALKDVYCKLATRIDKALEGGDLHDGR